LDLKNRRPQSCNEKFEQHTSFQDCYDPLIGIGPTPHLPFDQISSSLVNPATHNQGSYLHGSGGQPVDDYHQINNLLNNNSCKDILSTAYSSVTHGSITEGENFHNINDKSLTMDYDNQNDNGGPFSVMSDHELSSLNIKDLNRKLKEKGLSKEMIEKLKQRRRTLKNRKYATDCREKKDTEVHCLESTKDGEAENLGGIEKENEELRETLVKLKNHYAKVLEFAKKNNIELKPRNIPGMPSMAGFNPGGSDGGDTSGDDSSSIIKT